MLTLALVAAAVGCREDAESPTAPEPAPALATTATPALAFRQVSVGGFNSCGVTTDDRAYCWGNNQGGQLGDGTTEGPETCTQGSCSTRPVAGLGGLRFRHVSAGNNHTCGITTDFRAFCWGINNAGQVGDGTSTGPETCSISSFEFPCSTRPVAVAGRRRFRQVRASGNHTCAITPDDVAFCWGYNAHGQLGDGTTEGPETCTQGSCSTRPVAVAGGLRWRQLSGGSIHTCGVTTAGRAYCWGNNFAGQLGDRTKTGRLTPVAVSGGLLFRQIAAGAEHTCGVTTADRAYCWGSNFAGEIGDGTTNRIRLRPVAVSGQRRFDNLSAGNVYTCGVTLAGRGFCWGSGFSGQLGDGAQTGRLTPTAVSGGLLFRQIEAGLNHTCGVTTAGRAYCWGDNDAGELGDGTQTDRLTPVAVVGPT